MLTAELDDFSELQGLLGGRDASRVIGPEDVAESAGLLDRGNCALLVLIEHLWAAEAADAVREAGGAHRGVGTHPAGAPRRGESGARGTGRGPFDRTGSED